MTLSPADLARVIHASYGRAHVDRLLPTSSTKTASRNRRSAFDLARRLRLEHKIDITDAELVPQLVILEGLGGVDRGNGGWAACWERLGEIGQASSYPIARARRGLR